MTAAVAAAERVCMCDAESWNIQQHDACVSEH
jgi:hypothetical protein